MHLSSTWFVIALLALATIGAWLALARFNPNDRDTVACCAEDSGVQPAASAVTLAETQAPKSGERAWTPATGALDVEPSSSSPRIVRPTSEDEVAQLQPWFDDVFRPQMHLRNSGFVDLDWRLFEDLVSSYSSVDAPLRISIDLGISIPAELVIEDISRNEANTVTSVSGGVFRNGQRVGSAILRPSLERQEFRGYVRTSEGKFIFAPTPRPPAHVVYLNDWRSIKKADAEFLESDPDYKERNDELE